MTPPIKNKRFFLVRLFLMFSTLWALTLLVVVGYQMMVGQATTLGRTAVWLAVFFFAVYLLTAAVSLLLQHR